MNPKRSAALLILCFLSLSAHSQDKGNRVFHSERPYLNGESVGVAIYQRQNRLILELDFITFSDTDESKRMTTDFHAKIDAFISKGGFDGSIETR
jgi:hypothetical protein